MLSVVYTADAMLGKIFRKREEINSTEIVAAIKSNTSNNNYGGIESSKQDAFSPSLTAIQMNQVIQSSHVNQYNILDGGQLLKWVDTCACLSAERLAGYPCVTVSVDDLHFENEVKLGQVLNLKAQVNRAFTTSMEVGVKVSFESLTTQEIKPVCDAFITFVALDNNGKKVKLPPFLCQKPDEKTCFALANERRKVRITHANTVKQLIADYELSPLRSPSPKSTLHDASFPSVQSVNGADTRVESVELVLPPHANHHGNTFGGQVMAWMENVASISAGRLCHGLATLRSVDMVYFRGPSTVGDRIVLTSIVNNSFETSLEVGVRVEAYRYENGKIGERRHINSAFLSYDITSSGVKQLPPFLPEPKDGMRRQKEAAARRKIRLDRRYILSLQRNDRLSVAWSRTNAMYLCYGNITALSRIAGKSDWTVAASTTSVTLCTREQDGVLSFCVTLKPQTELCASDVFDVLKNPFKRVEWDPLTLSCDEVKRIGDEDGIYHTVMKSQTSEVPNDFVLLVSDRRPATDSDPYKVAFRSVTHDRVPQTTGFSRTEVACAGFVIRQDCGTCTEISYYNETNPKLVSYVTCDLAGLGALYCRVFHCLENYLVTNTTVTS
uniref:acyl-coenzyme A thioesterase 11-like isoform X1 n=1 Tax=Ciona intestinalis TaxID=7719 RepID=UPI0005213908|nr:acyl-coenzyme A thioesterase 11-like isoform X1 [Ciona intestinalis]|eukprot:XP_009858759.1 acyl-coenzyme A thioesterase 11-like isoform X1 [Ciona intestinalis]